jgi:cyclic pyranopterin phosphate synthase
MKKLSHLDDRQHPLMVDVGDKVDLVREAKAQGFIQLQPATVELIKSNSIRKGNVLVTAELAGINAAKRTFELIPLCHLLALTQAQVICEVTEEGVKASSLVRCVGKTGVEMEALTAVSVALLTIYDMVKAVDQSMVIREIVLVEKTKRERT